MPKVRKLENFIDPHGMVIAFSRDGGIDAGDSAHSTGQMYIALFIIDPDKRGENSEGLNLIAQKIIKYVPQHGTSKLRLEVVRHWNEFHWPGMLQIMSRDNLEPILASLALYSPYNEECYEKFDNIMHELYKRKGFTWNFKHIWGHPSFEPKLPDLIFPWDLYARSIRGKRRWYLYPILCLFDAGTLVNSIIRVIKSLINPDNTSGCLNHQGRMVFKTLIYPTPTNWMAKMIYKLRKKPTLEPGDTSLGNTAIEVYQSYYWDDRHPPCFEFWLPITKEIL